MTPIWFVRIPPASGLTEQEADEFQWMRVDQATGEPAKTRPSLPGWLALNLLSHAYEKEKITLHCSSCSSSVCVRASRCAIPYLQPYLDKKKAYAEIA